MVEFIISGNAARQERYDYSLNAIREIVINMLIHRDYRDSSSSLIKIFDDSITFYNPGKLFGGITINDLLIDNFTSKPRNKLIAKSFREIGKIERYGSGISRIIKQCREYGNIEPKFEEIADGFKVTLFKKKTDQKTIEEKILSVMKDKPEVAIKEIATKINKGVTVTKERIKKLKQLNAIERIGADRRGYWKVNIEPD